MAKVMVEITIPDVSYEKLQYAMFKQQAVMVMAIVPVIEANFATTGRVKIAKSVLSLHKVDNGDFFEFTLIGIRP